MMNIYEEMHIKCIILHYENQKEKWAEPELAVCDFFVKILKNTQANGTKLLTTDFLFTLK